MTDRSLSAPDGRVDVLPDPRSDRLAEVLGRDREIDALRGALGELVAGQGAVVWLSGEPGIGKSTLAGMLAADASELGCEVYAGRAEEGAAWFPLRFVVDALVIRVWRIRSAAVGARRPGGRESVVCAGVGRGPAAGGARVERCPAGRSDAERGALPASLAMAIEDRFSFLSEETTAVLRMAAVLGVEFSRPYLAALSGCTEVDLGEHLGEAGRVGILATSGARVRFRHTGAAPGAV